MMINKDKDIRVGDGCPQTPTTPTTPTGGLLARQDAACTRHVVSGTDKEIIDYEVKLKQLTKENKRLARQLDRERNILGQLEGEHEARIERWRKRAGELGERCKSLEEERARLLLGGGGGGGAYHHHGNRRSRLSIRTTTATTADNNNLGDDDDNDNSKENQQQQQRENRSDSNESETHQQIQTLKLVEKLVSRALVQLESPAAAATDDAEVSSTAQEGEGDAEAAEAEAEAEDGQAKSENNDGLVERSLVPTKIDSSSSSTTTNNNNEHKKGSLNQDNKQHMHSSEAATTTTNTTANNHKPNTKMIRFRGNVFTQSNQFELALDFELGDEDEEEEGGAEDAELEELERRPEGVLGKIDNELEIEGFSALCFQDYQTRWCDDDEEGGDHGEFCTPLIGYNNKEEVEREEEEGILRDDDDDKEEEGRVITSYRE